MLRKAFLFTVVLVLSLSAVAAPPITLFQTLKDYQSGKGKVIGEFEGYEWSKDAVLLLTPPTKGKKPVVHDITGYWGYSIGDQLYRMYEGLPQTLHLIVILE